MTDFEGCHPPISSQAGELCHLLVAHETVEFASASSSGGGQAVRLLSSGRPLGEWWSTHSSAALDPAGVLNQPRHLPSTTSRTWQQQSLYLCPSFKATEPEKAQRACPQGEAAPSQQCGTDQQLLHLTRCCCVSAAHLFPFDLVSDLLNCSLLTPAQAALAVVTVPAPSAPQLERGMSPSCNLCECPPALGTPGCSSGCSSHAYPSVPRAGVLGHARGCL